MHSPHLLSLRIASTIVRGEGERVKFIDISLACRIIQMGILSSAGSTKDNKEHMFSLIKITHYVMIHSRALFRIKMPSFTWWLRCYERCWL